MNGNRFRKSSCLFKFCVALSAAITVHGFGELPGKVEQRPAFEVCVIRPSLNSNSHGPSGGPGTRDPELFRYHFATLMDLIQLAWNMDTSQIRSHANLSGTHFDVDARVPPGTTKEQFRLMLQELLIDRFQLREHTEVQLLPVYEMTSGPSGIHLSTSTPTTPPLMAIDVNFVDGYEVDHIKARHQPLTALARLLQRQDRLPVINKTGDDENYDFDLAFSRAPTGTEIMTPPPLPDLFVAVEQQLGVRFKREKNPMPVIVIDAFERMPRQD